MLALLSAIHEKEDPSNDRKSWACGITLGSSVSESRHHSRIAEPAHSTDADQKPRLGSMIAWCGIDPQIRASVRHSSVLVAILYVCRSC